MDSELKAANEAIKTALEKGYNDIVIFVDCEPIIGKLNKQYQQQIAEGRFIVINIIRRFNHQADVLSKQARYEKELQKIRN